MPPVAIAFVNAVLLFVAFWTTRGATGGKKWGLRFAAAVALLVLGSVLAADATASAIVGEYSVYFGLAAVVLYAVVSSFLSPARG